MSRSITPKRILVADDDFQDRELFLSQLSAAGYDVQGATTGRDALAALRAVRFDLLVLDLNMPETDGFEVLKNVRAQMPDVHVLVISGYMKGVLLKAAEWFGAAATLEKMLAPDLLVPTVRQILGDE